MVHIRLTSRTLRLISAPIARSATRWTSRRLAQDVFQRVPPMAQLLVLAIAIWGPVHAPVIYGTLCLAVHLVFIASNARTAYGMRYACKAVEACAATDWRAESGSPLEFDAIKHLIILPNYKETLDTLRETLTILASHPVAWTSYRICLACEENEAGAQDKALLLMREFSGAFYDMQFTLHHRSEDEAAGKSSNVSWASKEMHLRGLAGNVITVMDADSAFASDFFASVASKYVAASEEDRRVMFFVAPIFFDRNASDVAPPVACTDILWCAAGLGTMYEGSRSKLPTSAYAVSTDLAIQCGFWDTNAESIGEDLHMSVKAWFETSGRVKMISVHSPASQCNIVGFRYPRVEGTNISVTQRAYEWSTDLVARYGQAKRHLWGSLDSGYALRRLATGHHGFGSDLPPIDSTLVLEDGYEDTIPDFNLRRNRSWSPDSAAASPRTPPSEAASSSETPASEEDDPFMSDSDPFASTSSASSPPSSVEGSPRLLPSHLDKRRLAPSMDTADGKLPFFDLLVVMSRLYEAHFNLGFLFTLLTIAPYFNPGLEPSPLWKLRPSYTADPGAIPRTAMIATTISSHLGTVALLCTIAIFYYYERFHHITTTTRWEGRPHMGRRAYQQTIRTFPGCAITYAGLPFTLFFGIIPLYHSQLIHLWTNRLTYQVSAKPVAVAPPPTSFAMRDVKTSVA